MTVTTMVAGKLSVRGRFDGKHVELLEPPPTELPCEVTITFGIGVPHPLSDEERREIARRTSGAWADDPRTTDEIIRDIYESRTLGREDIEL